MKVTCMYTYEGNTCFKEMKWIAPAIYECPHCLNKIALEVSK